MLLAKVNSLWLRTGDSGCHDSSRDHTGGRGWDVVHQPSREDTSCQALEQGDRGLVATQCGIPSLGKVHKMPFPPSCGYVLAVPDQVEQATHHLDIAI
jgi:hypothetical protein